MVRIAIVGTATTNETIAVMTRDAITRRADDAVCSNKLLDDRSAPPTSVNAGSPRVAGSREVLAGPDDQALLVDLDASVAVSSRLNYTG